MDLNSQLIYFTDQEDYTPFRIPVFFDVGDSRKCVGVVIQEDQQPEQDELFLIVLENNNTFESALVIIQDDDGMLNSSQRIRKAVMQYKAMH